MGLFFTIVIAIASGLLKLYNMNRTFYDASYSKQIFFFTIKYITSNNTETLSFKIFGLVRFFFYVYEISF